MRVWGGLVFDIAGSQAFFPVKPFLIMVECSKETETDFLAKKSFFFLFWLLSYLGLYVNSLSTFLPN